jgi:hypothetical protein
VDNGLPQQGQFNTENFCLHNLIVGNEDEEDPESVYGPVELVLNAQADNQEQWQGTEALYVDILTIDPGGTFDLSNANLYFLRTSDEEQADPRKLFLGDADLDGDVDFTDYQALERNFGTTAGALWGQGDFDGDRDVDFTDYQTLERNYGQGGRGEGREGDAGGERLDSEGRALPVLKDYDGDGDVDIDDLRILQAMRQEEDEP